MVSELKDTHNGVDKVCPIRRRLDVRNRNARRVYQEKKAMITDRQKYILMVNRQHKPKEPNYSPEEIRLELEKDRSKQKPEKTVKNISS